MYGAVITDLNNITVYLSDRTERLSTINYTPSEDCIAYLSKWVEQYDYTPTIEIVDNYTNLKNIVDDYNFDEFSNLKWGLMGDSITATTWRATKNYWGFIQDRTNIQINNVAVSGVGYTRGGANSIPNQVANLNNQCDIITIMAGVNDIAWTENPNIGNYNDNVNAGSIMGYVNDTLDKIENKFGGKIPVGFITPLPSCIQPNIFDENYENRTLYPKYENNNMTKYVNELIKLCNYRGYPILNLYNNSCLLPELESCRNLYFKPDSSNPADGLHPNADGHKFIHNAILQFLKTMIS